MVFLALVWLLLLLLAIVGGSLEQYSTLTAKSFVTRAVSPDFQAYDADPQLRQAHGLQLRQGFNDALIMASVTALLFNPCEDTFLRYFEEDDADFVRGVFDAVANFPVDPLRLPEGLRPILAGGAGINSKYSQVSISAGDHIKLHADERECANVDPDVTLFAHTRQFADLGNQALISICPVSFRFPSLGQILDPSKAGPGCAGLGPVDSGWMTSLGGHILHELIRWRFLVYDGPLFDETIVEHEGVPDGENIISDYDSEESSEIEPPNGYGPYNTRQRREHKNNDAVNNVDNYRWYAQSMYWKWKCGRSFGPAPDDSYTDMLRVPS